MNKGQLTISTLLIGILVVVVLSVGFSGNALSGAAVTGIGNGQPTLERVLITPHSVNARNEIAALGVSTRHEFVVNGKPAFSADIPSHLREKVGTYATVEDVPVYHLLAYGVTAKPVCGDGKCQGRENASNCPADCSSSSVCGNNVKEAGEDCDGTDDSTCPGLCQADCSCGSSGTRPAPDDQTPYGIEIIYNDASVTTTSGGAGINIAVLDSGVNINHEDLKRRVAQCKDFTGRPGKISNKCTDKNGHGTHVAGTILADGGKDGKGIYGVAPEANLFAYRVCGGGGCFTDDMGAAIRHAADEGANIISMSIGGNTESILVKDAITYAVSKGVLVVAAAGNDGPNLGSIDYPGANKDVVGVAAIDSTLTVPSFSSRGIDTSLGDNIIQEREVEVATPGVRVESTWKDGGYQYLTGTSMATPHYSGLAAKLWQGSASATRTHLQNKAALNDITQGTHAATGDDASSGFGLPQV